VNELRVARNELRVDQSPDGCGRYPVSIGLEAVAVLTRNPQRATIYELNMAINYRDLVVWRKAMDLVVEVYRLTSAFPDSERFGLTDQLRRAAVSVPSNIAEGQGWRLRKQFALFLRTSRGSIQELETQILIAQRLGYTNADSSASVLRLADDVSRLLSGLLRSLKE
jgi:four helix bundle protein